MYYRPIVVAYAYNPSTSGGQGGWIMRSRDRDHPGQRGETLSLLKIQKNKKTAGITGAHHNAQLFFCSFVFLVETGFHHVGQAGLKLLTSSEPPASASQVAEITGMCHHIWLIFVFLVEMGFHHVDQAGLKLLTSSEPPTSTSQSTKITDVSQRAWLCSFYSFLFLLPPPCRRPEHLISKCPATSKLIFLPIVSPHANPS